ncbi:MAG: alpha/beta hydrolase [Methylotetracoccus sp.]
MTAERLPCIEIDPPTTPKTSIIWLHGLGADGHDFEPIAAELRLPPALAVRFVFPHAPQRPVTINGGYVMRAWYDIAAPDLGQGVDLAGVEASRRAVERLVDDERAAGREASHIILAGFSQGGVIALETAAHYSDQLGGVIALSTYLAAPAQFPPARGAMPVFMAHGTQDPIVPYGMAQRGSATLDDKGYAVEWHDYPMPHSVCGQEIADLRAWLLRRLMPGGEQ